MSFNARELGLRIVTGLSGIGLILYLIFNGDVGGVRFIAWGVSVLTLIEYSKMAFSTDSSGVRLFFLIGTTLVHGLQVGTKSVAVVAYSFLVIFMFFLLQARKRVKLEQLARDTAVAFFGFFYLGILPLFLVDLRLAQDTPHLVALYCFLIWATDVGGYFVGKSIGRTPLYPAISPKKSVEGLLGGIALSIVTALCYRAWFLPGIPLAGLMITTVLVCFFSQVGDLCESFFKRAFDVKDSGSLLPGHGGVLDRFDGFIWALPVIVACLPMLR